MSKVTRMVSLTVFTLALTLAACTGGGDGGGDGGAEEKYSQAIASVNKDWKIAEMKKEKEMTVIRIEVDDNVPFAEGKKVVDAIQKTDPKFNGYVEFFNGQVGMVIRKLEIFPAT